MIHKFGQGDMVRVLEGPHSGREGAIYDAIGIPHDPWMKLDEDGRPEYRVYFGLEGGIDAGWFGDDDLEMVQPMPEVAFRTGDRVRVRADAYWAQGELGTVNPGAWAPPLTPRVEHRREGPVRVHMVHLDHPRRDASGDGPYSVGSFEEAELERVGDRSDRAPAYPAAHLASQGEALKQVMENPELGKPVKRGQTRPTN
jgi:hypothetical protein